DSRPAGYGNRSTGKAAPEIQRKTETLGMNQKSSSIDSKASNTSKCSSSLSPAAVILLCQTSIEDGWGREMALGPLRVSGALPGGDDSKRKEVELKVSLVVNSLVDGAQEVRLDGGEEFQERAVSADEVLSSPCLSMLGSSTVSCPASEAAGAAVEVGDGESQMPASSLVSPTLSSCVCVAEQRAVVVWDGGEQL
ncbi:hypothetical protein Dimus_003410, partial [Dionaea muscipula]